MASQHPFTPEDAAYSLNLLGDTFGLYTGDEFDPPAPEAYGRHLLKHPDYLSGGKYDATATFLAHDKALFEDLTPVQKDLGRSLIAATFSENELRELAQIN